MKLKDISRNALRMFAGVDCPGTREEWIVDAVCMALCITLFIITWLLL